MMGPSFPAKKTVAKASQLRIRGPDCLTENFLLQVSTTKELSALS